MVWVPALASSLPLFLLPGMDGTGRLFARFIAAAPQTLTPRALAYPSDRSTSYAEVESLVRSELPREGRFAVLGESYSGPVAIRIAARPPPGLIAVVLVATFHRRPVPSWVSKLLPLARVAFAKPPPDFGLRKYVLGSDASDTCVAEVKAAIASVKPAVLVARAREAVAVDVSKELASAAVPILAISGTKDELFRRGIPEEMQAIRPAMQVHTLGGPHMVLQTHPGDAAVRIEEFLRALA